MKRGINKKGQVWVETVIYTLIAFTMIGLVLSYAKPKIEEIQDKAIIEQSIDMMKEINEKIVEVKEGGAGNKREIILGMKKGILKIDGIEDKIFFEIESRYTYSQLGENIIVPLYAMDLIAHTEKKGKFNTVTLTMDYSEENNITYQGGDELKTISKAPTPYKLFFSNEGGDKTIIDIKIV